MLGLSNCWGSSFIRSTGEIGVTFFFVLSGFLITYFLLSEKSSTKNISLSNFYTKRVLRILPLYYLIVALGLFVLPHFDFFYIPHYSELLDGNVFVHTVLFLLILPNIVLFTFGNLPYLDQTWAVGTEIQFYLLWPLIIKYSKRILLSLFLVLLFFVLVRTPYFLIENKIASLEWLDEIINLEFLYNFFYYLRISCMAIGGMGAYLLFHKDRFQRIKKFLFSKPVQILSLFFAIYFTYKASGGFVVPLVYHELFSVLFCIIIINFAANKNRLFSLEFNLLNYLGKISYGIYMFHNIMIMIAVKATLFLFATKDIEGVFPNLVVYFIAFSSTVMIAVISFEFFEKKFLKLKPKCHSFSKTNSNASAALYPAPPPLTLASDSIYSSDLGCGNSRSSPL